MYTQGDKKSLKIDVFTESLNLMELAKHQIR